VFEQIVLNGLLQTLWRCIVCKAPSVQSSRRVAAGAHRQNLPKGTDAGIDSYSGLFDNGHRKSTGLGEWLRGKGVTEVFVCGLATDYCVKSTALDAAQFGFNAHFIEDASRGSIFSPTMLRMPSTK